VGGARTGTDKTHLATKDIEDLREFIEASSAEDLAERDEATVAGSIELSHRLIGGEQLAEVAFVAGGVCIDLHAAET
jgi:hypothetical protein